MSFVFVWADDHFFHLIAVSWSVSNVGYSHVQFCCSFVYPLSIHSSNSFPLDDGVRANGDGEEGLEVAVAESIGLTFSRFWSNNLGVRSMVVFS